VIQIENNQNFKLTKKILDRYKSLPRDSKILKNLNIIKEDKHLSERDYEKLTMEKLKESKVGDQFYKHLCYLTDMKLQGRN